MTAATESPLARLSEQELEKLAKELDAIHDEVFAELGDRDRHYIKTMISVQRQIVVALRALLRAGLLETSYLLREGRHLAEEDRVAPVVGVASKVSCPEPPWGVLAQRKWPSLR